METIKFYLIVVSLMVLATGLEVVALATSSESQRTEIVQAFINPLSNFKIDR